MDGSSGKASSGVPDADAGLEAEPAFTPLDPADLSTPAPRMAGYEAEASATGAPAGEVQTCPQCGASFAGAPADGGPLEISLLRVAIAVLALLALGAGIGAAVTYAALHGTAPPATAPPPPASAAPPPAVVAPVEPPPAVAPPPAVIAPVEPPPAVAPPPAVIAPVEPPPAVAPPAAADRSAKPAPVRPSPPGRMIADPVWMRRPTGAEVSRLYPSLPQDEGLGGEATIDCAVTVSGRLRGCAVVAERPLHRGFGPATLKLAPRFQMRTVTRSGEPVEGRRVRVPVRWRLD